MSAAKKVDYTTVREGLELPNTTCMFHDVNDKRLDKLEISIYDPDNGLIANFNMNRQEQKMINKNILQRLNLNNWLTGLIAAALIANVIANLVR